MWPYYEVVRGATDSSQLYQDYNVPTKFRSSDGTGFLMSGTSALYTDKSDLPYPTTVNSDFDLYDKNGTRSHFAAVRSDPQRTVFGVVAFVPNLSHDGDTLLIESISMPGTEAAMDFVTDDAQLLPFLRKIQRVDGSVPHFEVLLETHSMGAGAVQSHILVWRTIN